MDITFSNVTESDLKIIVGLFGPHCDAPTPEIPTVPAEKATVKTTSQAVGKKEQIAAPAPGNAPKTKREKSAPPTIPGKKGFQPHLGIPYKNQNPDGSQNQEYRKAYNLCRQHKCTYPELIENGIVKPDAPPTDPTPQAPAKSDAVKQSDPAIPHAGAKTTGSNAKKHTLLTDPFTIVPGLKVRQLRPDAGRMFSGVGQVTARRGELIEVRDSDGKTWKILSCHLEPVNGINETVRKPLARAGSSGIIS
ncbi:hypothetical protein [Methanoregula sp.]|jgi:hypothetical protein|uniref:hypothetical protein n=1 Tax=Methanoregula sp. TaxID=2052170 RepID=UPI0025F2ED0E|nr:hypothetical protein [Methanoregula sp.]